MELEPIRQAEELGWSAAAEGPRQADRLGPFSRQAAELRQGGSMVGRIHLEPQEE